MDFKAQYLAAVKRDQDVRDAAFLNLTTNICGVEIRQMTLRDFLILDGLGLVGLFKFSEEHLIRFLWLLSPKYRPGKWRGFWFARKHRKINFGEAVKAVEKYLEDTFQDSPGGAQSNEPDYASYAGYMVFRMGESLGWEYQTTVNAPLKVLFQLLKCIRRDKDPKCEVRSRRLLKWHGDRLRLINARQSLVNLLNRRAQTN